MGERRKCSFPGCEAELNRGYLACRKHWFLLDCIQRAKAMNLYLYHRDRYAADLYLQDQFAALKGEQS